MPKPGFLSGFTSFTSEKSNGEAAVEILPEIDSTFKQNTHPTLIPWNPTTIFPTALSEFRPKQGAQNGVKDGEIRAGGGSSIVPTNSSASFRKNLSIPPPNFKGFVDELVAIDKNGDEAAWPNEFPEIPFSSSTNPNQTALETSPNRFPEFKVQNIPESFKKAEFSQFAMSSFNSSQNLLNTTEDEKANSHAAPRRPSPSLILPPPEEPRSFFEFMSTTGEAFISTTTTKEDANSKFVIDNIPPLPLHPETTWIPLKFNIHPSELAQVERTTLSLPIINGEETESSAAAPWSVQGNGYRLETKTDLTMENNWREDLPIPDSGLPDKMLQLNGNATTDNIAASLGNRK